MTNTAKTETTKNTKTVREKRSFSFLSVMQNIGKSLVFPIATLPAAALLLRIGAFISGFDGDAAH
jgi:phosphotransferase system  glucose/maltose/N-acetylglucosamine-specific IIC component